MENHIKSKDLCDRCVFGFVRHCISGEVPSCKDCAMNYDTRKPGGCKCITIKVNTPCPYFVEAENNEAD